ncbi:MAG: CPBP family intramembrane metalloprotease [Sphingobacteriales bacterium]|nr:CPBP family intramembrane metalloprotease [Sphingobacteriales bacterium]
MNKQRIGQQVLHFPLTKIILAITLLASAYAAARYWLGELFKQRFPDKEINELLVSLLSSALVVLVYIFLFRLYERRKISELSLEGFAGNLLKGLFLGALLQSLTILVIYLNKGYQVVAVNSFLYILPGLALSFSSAIFEEILMRGVLFRVMEEKLGSYIALFLSAIIFGFLHLANENSSLSAAIGLAIQAGLLLAVAYIYARNLWFPIAIHFAWNFMETGIYGATVSGNTIDKTLVTSNIRGAEWFTGGAFGPEGSLQATVFCLAATVVLMALSIKQKKMIRPAWRK